MKLGLIGYPLEHSKSPEIFAQLFQQKNIKGSYTLYPLKDINALQGWLETETGLAGFNITIPYKKSIIPFLDKISEEAKAIGAVNTVKIVRANNAIQLHGYNTDYFGFKQSLTSFLGDERPKKALVLGTGGSSNAVAYVLAQMGIEYIKVSRVKSGASYITYNEITDELMQKHLLIINTTPLGMYPNIGVCPKINYEVLMQHHYLYDLVYNPTETTFLRQGKAKGTRTKNGVDMLKLQAQKAWEIWSNALT